MIEIDLIRITGISYLGLCLVTGIVLGMIGKYVWEKLTRDMKSDDSIISVEMMPVERLTYHGVGNWKIDTANLPKDKKFFAVVGEPRMIFIFRQNDDGDCQIGIMKRCWRAWGIRRKMISAWDNRHNEEMRWYDGV